MTLYRIAVLYLVHQITGWPLSLSHKTRKRRMASFFGVSQKVVRGVWNRLESKGRIPRGFAPKHLLWTLMFLKQYSTQTVLAALCGVRSEKTWEHWVWTGVHLLENLGLVSDNGWAFSFAKSKISILQQSVPLLKFHYFYTNK
jgi:hypothetical protein